jgi:small subunit ribosomal protein S20
MPHLKSSKKRLRSTRRRTEENEKIKEQIGNLVKSAKGEKDLPALYKAIDKAAKRGIYHRNRAARIKSSLSKRLSPKPATD